MGARILTMPNAITKLSPLVRPSRQPAAFCRHSVACRFIVDKHSGLSMEAMMLDTAQHDLEDYVRGHPEARDTLEWFMEKCHDVETALALGPGSSTFDEYLRVRQTLRELSCSGSTEAMVNTLRVLKRLEDRKRMGLPAAGSTPVFHRPPTSTSYTLSPEAREILVEIFHKADTDGNGRLSWSEFNNALHWIGDDLGEEETELVSSALNLQGSVSLEDFLAIVESAEQQRSAPASDAHFLRHLTHQHPSYVDHVTTLAYQTNQGRL